MRETSWDDYGRASGNRACQQCMVHCGYEPSAVAHAYGGLGGMWDMVKGFLFRKYASPAAQARLEEEKGRPHGPLAKLSNITIDGKPVASGIEPEPVEAA